MVNGLSAVKKDGNLGTCNDRFRNLDINVLATEVIFGS